MSRPSISDDQAQIYLERADEYDRLVSAEDADGNLRDRLRAVLPAATIADIGAGTGRIARLLAGHAERFVLVERAAPMLAIATTRLGALRVRFESHCADARELPLRDESVDAAVAGWVFGHFRLWMPDGWQQEVDAALTEMDRIVVPGGPLVVIETLGTGHEQPRTNEALDAYFAHLEARGFARSWLRTDYVFETAADAASVLGGFFGDAMAAQVTERGSPRVPECTGVWLRHRS
jgi:ubiquinone/menaquinone biosynthesis C-methylase UbiE